MEEKEIYIVCSKILMYCNYGFVYEISLFSLSKYRHVKHSGFDIRSVKQCIDYILASNTADAIIHPANRRNKRALSFLFSYQ
jgi:hypothetical protein